MVPNYLYQLIAPYSSIYCLQIRNYNLECFDSIHSVFHTCIISFSFLLISYALPFISYALP